MTPDDIDPDDDDLFRCAECGHGWNCYLDTGGDDRYECPNCGHDTGVEAPPYARRPA